MSTVVRRPPATGRGRAGPPAPPWAARRPAASCRCGPAHRSPVQIKLPTHPCPPNAPPLVAVSLFPPLLPLAPPPPARGAPPRLGCTREDPARAGGGIGPATPAPRPHWHGPGPCAKPGALRRVRTPDAGPRRWTARAPAFRFGPSRGPDHWYGGGRRADPERGSSRRLPGAASSPPTHIHTCARAHTHTGQSPTAPSFPFARPGRPPRFSTHTHTESPIRSRHLHRGGRFGVGRGGGVQ